MKKISKKEALNKVVQLFDHAELIARKHFDLANKHVKEARRIAMKSKVRIPVQLKRRFCKKCGAYFVPGKTYRVRMNDKKVVYTCLMCKSLMRFPMHSRGLE